MGKSVEEQWESNAQAFADLIADQGTPHHRRILNPCVENLLGEVKGKRVLDAGCGEGYLARYYASKGAQVVGVDLSKELIRIAKEKTQGNLLVEYRVDNICDMRTIPDVSFDIILSNLVLLNVPCLESALTEFHRVLVPAGILVFSIVHPAFDFYGPGEWEMGEKYPDTNRRKGRFFKMDRYFDEIPYERYWRSRDGDKFPEPITFFHRTIGTYVRVLTSTGFSIEAMIEPRPEPDDEFFEREMRIPFFLVFKACKKWSSS